MSERANTLFDEAHGERIRRLVQDAFDAAFRARVQRAVTDRIHEAGMDALVRRQRAAGIDRDRWMLLTRSTRDAASPAEFKAFARVLRVSARWLAIGSAEPVRFQAPPEGWAAFGTHVDQPDLKLEFSAEVDEEDGLPLWERAVA